ncbi:MAG TPA: hypothetical protein VMH87_19000 [Pseudomonadales bacterium]|nr:hypothetical protein [Pseudomonadales bacterium]
MKYHIKTIVIAALALATCQFARADILTVTNDVNVTTWDNVGGNAPFYSTSLSGPTAQGFIAPASGASYTVLSEYFTITNNGAGGMSAVSASSNYMLNAISFIAAGGSGPVQVHLFDITTNLTASSGTIYTGQAKYNFSANGDLLGANGGLTFSNNLPGSRQQVIVLQNGPNTQDQVILSTNHTYALEFWLTKAQPGIMQWSRTLTADPGGQGMGVTDASLTQSRITLNAIGAAGGTPRVFMMALYGTPTMATPSSNSNTNIGPIAFYTYDDFSTNGVSPNNPTNYDWFTTNAVYINGDITNVYANWFGGGFGSVQWNTNDAQNNIQSGSMQLNVNSGNGQWVLHRVGYPNNPGVSSLVYTGVEMDVRFDVSSYSAVTGGTTNYGPLRLGVRPNGAFTQDWFYYLTPITTTNWVHVVAPLSATDPNQQSWGELLIGMDPSVNSFNAGGGGPQTIYIDNVKFIGSATPPPVPPPTVQALLAKPGLRIFAGSAVNTYDRATVSSVNESYSWISPNAYPVTYTFSLLSYPANNINQTMIELIPNNGANQYLGGTYPAAGNQYFDYQSPNGMWLVLAPNGAGRVTASVQWKTNLPNANPNNIALTFTNPTAIGTWTWKFIDANDGFVIAPGGISMPFTVTNGTVTTDFANPVCVVCGLQPNAAAGEGLWEDWGLIAITNTSGGDFATDWTHQNSDFPQSGGVSPDGYWSPQGSANPPEIIIAQNGLDALWVNWTTPIPAAGFNVVEGTNIQTSPSTWDQPQFYSNGSDTVQPRGGQAVLLASKYWTLLTKGQLPTVNGAPQPSYPTITVPLSPNAFFIGSTNYANQP